jgi:hypothetical protein
MATRMQQRRGTAAQWTAANPVLAAGEIGFETDTNKFKMGNGTSAWASLAYFANATELAAAIDAVVGIAPETLDTLAEIAASLGDDPDFLSDLATNARLDSTIVSQAAALTDAITFGSSALSTHTANTMDVHGIANTAALALKSEVADAKSEAIVAAAADATSKVADAKTEAITEAVTQANTAISTAVSAITVASLGLGSVDNTSDLSKPVSSAQEYAIAAAKTEAITDAATAADDKISAHNLDETNVHGIADTSVLVTQTDLTNAINGVTVDQSALAGTGLAWDGVAEQFTVDTTIATKTYADGGVSTHNNATTSVHGISDTSQLAYKNAENQTFTGNLEVDGNLVVDGDITVNGGSFNASATSIVIEDNIVQLAHSNAANTVDLGLVVAYNDGSAKHSGIVRDVSDAKWKLFKDVTTEPTTTVNFGQGSLDNLAVNNIEVTGVVFTDGTQTKQGVPSLTTIIQKTDSYTLSSLSERDSMIEFSGQSGMTVTIPSDSSLNFPVGTSLDVLQTASGQVTIAGAQGVTVSATPGLKLRTQWSSATLVKRAANTWVVMGDLTA